LKPLLLVAFLVTLAIAVQSQQVDTTYYNFRWEVCQKPFYSSYRIGNVVPNPVLHYKGDVRDFYENDTKQMEGSYNDKGSRDGTFLFYYPNGKLEARGNFNNGVMAGSWSFYHPNGKIKLKTYNKENDPLFTVMEAGDSTGKLTVKNGTGTFEFTLIDLDEEWPYIVAGQMDHGQRSGTWKYFAGVMRTDRPAYEEVYEKGKLKTRNLYSKNVTERLENNKIPPLMHPVFTRLPVMESFHFDDTKAVADLKELSQEVEGDMAYGNTRDAFGAFKKVEIEASYPGDTRSWHKFLERTLRPEVGWEDLPKKITTFTQTVWVQFIVCTDGTVCEIQTMNHVLPSLKKEAERVIGLSGKWLPATKNGKAVKAYRKQPITFEYSEE
jgi:MORN repeat variant